MISCQDTFFLHIVYRAVSVIAVLKGIGPSLLARAQELCESRGSHPGLPVLNSPYGLCRRKATLNLNLELRSCVKVEVAVLGSPSLIVPTVSVDVKQH